MFYIETLKTLRDAEYILTNNKIMLETLSENANILWILHTNIQHYDGIITDEFEHHVEFGVMNPRLLRIWQSTSRVCLAQRAH